MASFSNFDTRGYRTVAAREGYDRWAASHEETVEDAMDVAGEPVAIETHVHHPISFAFAWAAEA